jgi:hypothetical protein
MPFTRLRKRPACVIGPLTTLGETVSWCASSSGLLAARTPAGLWIKNRVKRTRRDPPRDLRITRVPRCVARTFRARPSFVLAGCCWWRSLAVDGSSGASRGHAL